MRIRLLNAAGARQLYESRMARDFPPGELKPFATMEELLAAGLYEPLTFTDDAGAVLRGSGIGTRALHLLQAHYAPRLAALLLECEHPAEAPDAAVARRRIGFYLRAGARATALESRVFGARYSILQLPCGETLLPDGTLNTALQTLYSRMVPQPYYRGSVIFYGN